ncbi:hypothetical protein PsYK624_040180 [Phanerochaete sordida]|uniref:Uncharacterized protein n=1 Tax=Phanerochaete sordida TaxID=48140 RepID=A0A9P3G4Y7_9APHY|nr:hypothetical protein PsYK624_040180 [Phanerochaete sordida]
MAPKRKRVEETAAKAASKPTRSSTRNKAVEDDAETNSTAGMSVEDVAVLEDPPAKKAKKASAKTSKSTKSSSSKSKSNQPAVAEAAAAGVITNPK